MPSPTVANEPRAMRPPAVGLRVPSGRKRAPWVALAGRRNWPPAQKGDQVPQKIFLGCYQGSRCTRCSPRTVAATWLLRFPVISGSPETALLGGRCLIVRDAREHFASLHLQTLAAEVPGSPRRSRKRLESSAQTTCGETPRSSEPFSRSVSTRFLTMSQIDTRSRRLTKADCVGPTRSSYEAWGA